MNHATTSQMLGWTGEQCAVVDERLGLLARWMAANGKTEAAVEVAGADVDCWNRPRNYHGIWLKVTRSRLQTEIAIAVERAHPGIANEIGCGDLIASLGQGSVTDLDCWWIPSFGNIDFGKPIDEVVQLAADAIRAEGWAIHQDEMKAAGMAAPTP